MCPGEAGAPAESEPQRRDALLVPTFDNPRTIESVVHAAREHFELVIVVDDGSSEPGAKACQRLADQGLVLLLRRPTNGGKGVALREGMLRARELGISHVFQVDADGQHEVRRIPDFLKASRRQPEAMILGYPLYDGSAPRLRLLGHRIHHFWLELSVGRGRVRDAMIGFRVYPLGPLADVLTVRDRMEFDAEIVVRAAWRGIPFVNLPVEVRYLSSTEGGISHFRPIVDVLRLVDLHARFIVGRRIGRAS